MEGVGVVQAITESTEDDPGYAYSDVTLVRYERETTVARCMHEHWCDVERLTRCIRGDAKTLFVGDIDYELEDDDYDEGQADPPQDPYEVDHACPVRIKEIYARAEGRPVRALSTY
jgi:hypothetical protein